MADAGELMATFFHENVQTSIEKKSTGSFCSACVGEGYWQWCDWSCAAHHDGPHSQPRMLKVLNSRETMWTFLKGNGERQYSALAPNCHLFEENEHKSAKFA